MDTTQNTPNKLPLADRWIDVFRAGTHTDSKGVVCAFTQTDLDQIVTNHQLGSAPAVIGHPKETDPAYAWTQEVKRDGDHLYVKFKDVNPAFETGVETGAYRNRSVSVFKDPAHGWRLRHVGWLGAAPPAIDGLTPVHFSSDVVSLEFSSAGTSDVAWALETTADLFRNIREAIIADKGIEYADTIIPNYRIDSIESMADNIAEQDAEDDLSEFSTGGHNSMTTFTQAQLDAVAAKATADAELRFNQQLTDANSRVAAIEEKDRKDRIAAHVEGWKKDGKVLPADAHGLAEFMATLETAPQEFSFSAADGKATKKTGGDWFVNFMAAQPVKIALGTKSTAGDGSVNQVDMNNSSALAGKIVEFMADKEAKGITVSYADALAAVQKTV